MTRAKTIVRETRARERVPRGSVQTLHGREAYAQRYPYAERYPLG